MPAAVPLGLIIAIFVGIIALLADRGARRSTRAGALLALVYGVWLLAPRVLALHHLAPRTTQHWLILDGFFVAVFVSIGAIAGLAASLPFVFYRLFLRQKLDRAWADVVWPMAWLPVFYLAASLAVEQANFGRLGWPQYSPETRIFLAAHAAAAVILLFYYALATTNSTGRDAARLKRLLLSMAAVGFVVLLFRAPGATYPAVTTAPLVRDPSATAHRPLLFVGVDAATWRVLRPLMESGRLPTFARLAREGVTGEMLPVWGPPYWSAQAWASILTGYDRAETGVNEDLAATARGLPPFEMPLTLDPLINPIYAVEYGIVGLGGIEVEPTPREGLKRVPIWERLSDAGVRTAVVRFPFTYPAPAQADYVVSNRLVNDLWDMVGVRTGRPELLVHPPEAGRKWLAHFSDDSRAERELPTVVKRFDWPQPTDLTVNPLDAARRALTVQQQMHDVSLDILKDDRAVEVLMLYVAGFDNIAHAFWQYRFPEDFPEAPPAADDVAELGPVVDRYLELLDRQLGELIGAFPSRPDVLIVSDHGMGPIAQTTLWRGWHAARGIFLASGPGISPGTVPRAVTYFDVVPTLLNRLGFYVPNDLKGTALLR